MANPTEELQLAAAHVKQQSPGAWKIFLDKFGGYVQVTKDNCIQSPVDMLQVNQGRAQLCQMLFDLLCDADKAAARVSERRK